VATARGEREDKLLLKLSEEADDANLWRSKDRLLLRSGIKRCRFGAEDEAEREERDEQGRENRRAERKKNLLQARERSRAVLSMDNPTLTSKLVCNREKELDFAFILGGKYLSVFR
jgi:hypothetical protein